MLSELLAPNFGEAVRAWGRKLEGAILLEEATHQWISGTVDGWEFDLEVEDDVVVADCSCPRYARGGLCEHLWAAILAADRRGKLGEVVRRGARRVVGADAERRQASRPWKSFLQGIVPDRREDESRQFVYWIDTREAIQHGNVSLTVGIRKRRADGSWGEPQPKSIHSFDVERIPDGPDRRILEVLVPTSWGFGSFRPLAGHFEALLPALCATGRFLVQHEGGRGVLQWNPRPWHARFSLEGRALRGRFERDGERLAVGAPLLLLSRGFLFTHSEVAPYVGPFQWLAELRRREFEVPEEDLAAFRDRVFELEDPPEIDWPEGLRLEESTVVPVPLLRLREAPYSARHCQGELHFRYGGTLVEAGDRRKRVAGGGRLLTRDFEFEKRAKARLHGLKFTGALLLLRDRVPDVASKLIEEGWDVEAESIRYKRPGEFKIEVVSGIDWFDLEGGVRFDSETVPFPKLLEALRHERNFVPLGDGSFGILPSAWLEKMKFLLGSADAEGEKLRFRRSQTFLLDALLAAEPQATCDASFAQLRERLKAFDGIVPLEPPATFRGTLRPYQKTGLGWMKFLREFGFGGCLADDMGLGKTIQALALLDSRRGEGPSLVVAPRSVVFNWLQEAKRFAPDLRVREREVEDADVVLTTYGELRRDAARLKNVEFDYVILDESQAIKNASSATAKAARLLRGRHKLALSGTPIENHVGELGSLFEFLNPGMMRRVGDADRDVLARVVRPFLLRRTKEQVAPELPEKMEQTVWCDLEPDERREYDELREHYRRLLAGADLKRSKIRVLEALLRLRQAACHRGLINPRRAGEPSTKLTVLLERIEEVLEEGHKALVFSQFTSLLAIVRDRLDRAGTPYAYLDGQTRDRAEQVLRFQSDPKCPLFLISLKAGGLGLNLTAAEYVFVLDPWWNPAAEAQAVDRTHRIGQERRVIACRLIARGTVEEKVLELQKSKRELVEAIVNEENSLLKDLTRDDLELLLS